MKTTNSSAKGLSLWTKLGYYFKLLRIRTSMLGAEDAAARDVEDLRRIVATFEARTGRKAADSSVLEIGFGARPRRAFLLTAFFREVHAIDLDAPVLSLRQAFATWRKNGFERAIKSVVRHALFDSREWPQYHAAAMKLLPGYAPDKARLIVGSVSSPQVWDKIGKIDFVFSRDVFEHIPEADLREGMRLARLHLSPEGMIITMPAVFTGIIGGHDPNWNVHLAEKNTAEDAWRHLTDPGFKVNTYLNRLHRREYVRLFEETGFTVERDEAVFGHIHAHLLTSEKRAELAGYDDYELFSNRVEFHLVPDVKAMSDT
ncbi:class I SAM-dependent methyltransferase [Qipengyuania sp. CAU 1752]